MFVPFADVCFKPRSALVHPEASVPADWAYCRYALPAADRYGSYRYPPPQAADGFVVAGLRELVDIQHAHHVVNRRAAFHQPGILVARNDLLFHTLAHQIAHQRSHHVV